MIGPVVFTAAAGALASSGDRLDKLVVWALRQEGHAVSRAEVQRWIAAGLVTVDGAPAAASSVVREGAQVKVRPAPAPRTDVEPDASVVLAVVYEDDDMIVIDKPGNMVVHPARGNWSGTLVHGLLAREGFRAEELSNDDDAGHVRPGIVHRLDKGTSGLLVVAKNAETREALKELFSTRTIEREYVAITVGSPGSGTIDTPYGRHPRDRLRFTSKGRIAGGKRAITHVTELEPLGAATLVACRLETGRTHQIRVHLAEQRAAPILGDPLYGKRPKDALLAELAEGLGRQALHARLLGFRHPRTGKAYRWESAMPADMQAALVRLRGATRPSI